MNPTKAQRKPQRNSNNVRLGVIFILSNSLGLDSRPDQGSRSKHFTMPTAINSPAAYDPLVIWGTITTYIADWSKRTDRGVRSIFGEISSRIVLIISSPITLLLYAFLLFVNWRLRMLSNSAIVLNNQNYDKMYRRHVKLTDITKNVKGMPAIPLRKLPWLMRPFIIQLVTALKSITNYQKSLSQKFENLDTPYAPLPKGMYVMTAKDFADRRVKGYEYLA